MREWKEYLLVGFTRIKSYGHAGIQQDIQTSMVQILYLWSSRNRPGTDFLLTYKISSPAIKIPQIEGGSLQWPGYLPYRLKTFRHLEIAQSYGLELWFNQELTEIQGFWRYILLIQGNSCDISPSSAAKDFSDDSEMKVCHRKSITVFSDIVSSKSIYRLPR